MPETKLVGQNYTPPDLIAKVTGRAKYAEDYRADGMLFTKLLLSPMPHARVRHIDARAARRGARAHERAAVSGRADSRDRRRRRGNRRRGDRAHRARSGAAAVRGR